MKFFVFKKKHIMLFLTILLVVIIVVVATLSFIKTTSPQKNYTVVIDAGHGGADVKLGQYGFGKTQTVFKA